MPATKFIAARAWIKSWPDAITAPKSVAEKVLERVDDDGLSCLIEP